MTTAGPFDRLPRDVRRRLDAFSSAVDRVGLDLLPTFSARPVGADHERSVANAELVTIETGREAAVAEARRIAWDYVERRYAAAAYRPGLGIVPGPPSADGPDRARLAASFGDAVTAIMLEDALDESDRDELLGPWASLAS